jgi:putative FmdB family regulatory protein
MTVPLYAYRCTKCGHRFEKIQHFNSELERECPKCKGLLERPLTAPGLHFKGSGFYVNDYSSGASSSAVASAPASTSAESKPPCASGGSCAACPAAAPATTSSAS